jgi:hypothetical protein
MTRFSISWPARAVMNWQGTLRPYFLASCRGEDMGGSSTGPLKGFEGGWRRGLLRRPGAPRVLGDRVSRCGRRNQVFKNHRGAGGVMWLLTLAPA